ncbi:hypothetical protein H8E77_22425 [bacterium]|nr:hypothetical protein [bacterium]
MDKDLGNTPAKKLQEGDHPAFDEHDIDNRHQLEYPKTKETIPIKTPGDEIDCENYRPQHQYTHLQEVIDNLPYLIMTLLGATILLLIIGMSVWGWITFGGFIAYGILGTLWFIVFICPYCHFFDTRTCPCGYGQIAPKIRPKMDGSRFNEKFKKHLPVIFPLWVIPTVVSITFLFWGEFSLLILVLFLLFAIDAFLVLPLISRKYGCAHCPQKDTCPWMSHKD